MKIAKKSQLLWEILVPVEMDKKEIPVSYHREWDEKVRAITGGLTIAKTTKGQWVSPDKNLFIEKMIPVRIACSENNIKQIANMTLKHYKQEQVMYYKISSEVYFAK